MRSATLTRVDQKGLSDIHLRLAVLEQRGKYFRNPVTIFTAVNGPAQLGVKVSFQIYQTKGVSSVEILRNTARDYGSAAVLQTYALSDLTINKPITYYDHDKGIVGKTAYYWIRTIPNPGAFQPTIQGPQIIAVPPQADTSLNALNDPVNYTNTATVDSIDAGSSATARIYGPGGVGTAWKRLPGFNAAGISYPAGTITGLSYTTQYTVVFDGVAFHAYTTTPPTLPDQLVFCGVITTVASGGGGGVGGGGGSGGGRGGGRFSQ